MGKAKPKSSETPDLEAAEAAFDQAAADYQAARDAYDAAAVVVEEARASEKAAATVSYMSDIERQALAAALNAHFEGDN